MSALAISKLEASLNNEKEEIAEELKTYWYWMKKSYTREELTVEDDDAYMDVRLIIDGDGCWTIHTGDAQYETSHKGFWGNGSLQYDWEEDDIDELCLTLARELVQGALEERAMY